MIVCFIYIFFYTIEDIFLIIKKKIVLVLDAVDNSGETHLQVDHNIYKRRLNLEGQHISDPEKSEGK